MMRIYKTNYSTSTKGFTIMELMIAVAIIGIAAAIAMPSIMDEMPKMRLKLEVRDIAQQMQLARLKAVNTNKKYRVVFTNNAYPTPDTYRVEVSDGGWNTVGSEVTINKDANIYDITFVSSLCEFKTNGTATNCVDSSGADGKIFLNVKNTNDRAYSIEVTSATGKVTIEDVI